MQKRAVGAAALMGVAALLTSACAGSSPAAGGGSTNATAAALTTLPAPATGAPARDASADLLIWADADQAKVLQKYADQFGHEQGIKVQIQVSTNVRKDFEDATNLGQGPDIMVGAHDYAGELVQIGAIAPINLSADQQAKFVPASIQAAKDNGRLYGVPYATESLGLVRNTALAPDAPGSFEDMLTKGEKLVTDGKVSNALVQQVGKTGDFYNAYPYFKAFGGGIFAQKDNGDYDPTKVLIDDPGSVKGGAFMAQLGKDGVLSTNIDYDQASSLFTSGKAPYWIVGPWAIDKIKDAKIPYGISALPTIQGQKMTPFLGVQMFYVSAKARNDAFAQEFVTSYATKPELQEDLFNAGHRPPALLATLTTVSAVDPDVKAWSEAGQGALPVPNIPAMSSVWGPTGQATADLVAQQGTAQERLAAAQKDVVDSIHQNG